MHARSPGAAAVRFENERAETAPERATPPTLLLHDSFHGAHARVRYPAAQLQIHAGANPLVVQRMLGHASAAMTLDVYADLFESDLAVVPEKVGNLWARQA